MTDLDRLWVLQQVDGEIHRIRRELEAHPACRELQQAREQLQAARERLEGRTQELAQLRQQVRQGEREVRAAEEEVRALEARLFGGSVTHPKELSSLQGRLEALRRKLDELQDRVLEAMEALEQAEADCTRLQKEIRQQESLVQERQARWDAVRTELEQTLSQLVARRQEVASGIAQPLWLSRYERLYSAKEGRPVAEVAEDRCSGCGAPVPALLLEALRRPERPVLCEVCGRILYRRPRLDPRGVDG